MDVVIKRDGLNLQAKYERVDDKIVILSHGFSANMGYKEDSNYKVLSEQLNNIGFSTIRFDFNGHGKSDGKQEDMTVLNEIADLMAVIKYVKSLGHKEIYLLGHSQGGVVSAMTAGMFNDQIKALVLMAPAVALKYDALNGCTMGVKYDPNNIPDVVDLHGFFKVGGEYLRTAQVLPIYEVAKNYKGPVCLVHGLNDELVTYKYSEELSKVFENNELHLMEDENHDFKIHRQEAFDVVLNFLKGVK